jgi:very-short-patch-repair endonuclease
MHQDANRRLDRLAERQGSLFTRAQAYACGVPKRTVDRRVASGRWVPVGLDVLRHAAVPVSDSLRLRAATLALRASVVSHEAAAERHGLHYVPRGRLTVAVPVRSTRRFPGVKVRELTDLRDEDVVHLDDLPYTTPERTAADLAAVLHPDRLTRVIDDGLASGILDVESLCEVHASLARRGKPGFAQLRRILDGLGPGVVGSMSALERRFAALVSSSELPVPVAQFRPPWWQGREGIVDYAFPEHHVIVELDGRRWHARNATYDDDRRRDNAAQLAGWRVFRFTWDDIVKRPDYVLATLAAALADVA